ncbi:cytochrome o ubiquinol oxidase subunit IV [Bartonella sp. B35(2025)]
MSTHNAHNETHSSSTGSYLVGFILAVFFTLGSFIPVMYGMMESWLVSTKVMYLIGMALIQIIVQIVFFLHLNSGPDAKWNLSALWFASICVFIIIGGTWWAMWRFNYNMMGGSGRVIEPEMSEVDSSVSVGQYLQVPVGGVLPDTKTPVEQSPNLQSPAGVLPDTKTPVEQSPNLQSPAGVLPDTETPVEQSPNLQSPAGVLPNTETPVEQSPNLQSPVEVLPDSEMPMK